MSGENNGGSDRREGGFSRGFLTGLFCGLLCILAFLAGWTVTQKAASGSSGENQGAEILTDYSTRRKLKEIRNLIEQNYLDEVDSGTLSTYLFKGLAAGLDDPYANYYSAEELQAVQESNHGGYFGIGAVIAADVDSGEFQVREVYEGSPAQLCGLQAEDVLLEVDGVALDGLELSDVVDLIKSQAEDFQVQVFRPAAGEYLTLTMECGEVELTYVQYEMKTDRIGYISLSDFTQLAVTQFQDALESLQEQGMEKLIVDLRGNPGGLLDSVCDILGMFQSQALCVYTEDRNGNRQEYYTEDTQVVDCPVAVLVDGDSASASELFAGAIQDWGLGPIIGSRTYGKGVVQKTYVLSDGSAFKFTVEKYYTPNGQDIQGNGITPDIVVEESARDGADTPEGSGASDGANAPEGSGASDGMDAPNASGTSDGMDTPDPVLEKALEFLLKK